ncbi:MAG: energy-coupling factor transporter transmembrane component T family protein [Candidatus Aquicultor sp.]
MKPGLAIGQYYPSDSIVHSADPRIKILLVGAYALAVFLIGNFTGFAVVGVLLGLLVILGRLPFGLVLRGIRPLFVILAFTLLVQLFTGGEPWASIGPLKISVQGFKTGIFLDLRVVLLIIGASLLTLTTTPVALTDALEYLLSPLKRVGVPSHELAMMTTIAMRFIPILSTEADKIIKAQSARCARFDARNPVVRARSFIPILVPLFVSVFRRADNLAEVMEARAYRGGEGRTRMRELKMKPADWVGFVVVMLLFAGTVCIGRMPGL